MGKGFLYGNGGSRLNFKVVGGTTAPANPSENTIWVNTAAAITGYVFSAEEPSSSSEGVVWIKTDKNYIDAGFNALKSKYLGVYPASCRQYVSGAWVDKTAKIYRNGAWAELAPEPEITELDLWDGGSVNTDVTGGWNGSLTDMKAHSWSGGNAVQQARYTCKKIDLTDYSTLRVDRTCYSTNTSGGGTLGVGVSTTESMDNNVGKVEQYGDGTSTFYLDVSGLSGSYYIVVSVVANYSPPPHYAEYVAAITKMTLVK